MMTSSQLMTSSYHVEFQIVGLWRLVVLDPNVCEKLRKDFKNRLEEFHLNTLNHIKNSRCARFM